MSAFSVGGIGGYQTTGRRGPGGIPKPPTSGGGGDDDRTGKRGPTGNQPNVNGDGDDGRTGKRGPTGNKPNLSAHGIGGFISRIISRFMQSLHQSGPSHDIYRGVDNLRTRTSQQKYLA